MSRLFDASVLVAAFSREADSAQAMTMLTEDPSPVVNALALAETRIALIRKRKRSEMTTTECQSAFEELQRALDDGFLTTVPQPEAMWEEAVTIAARVAVHLRTQDALHAACAKLNAIDLATFDHDLAAASRAEGVDVIPI